MEDVEAAAAAEVMVTLETIVMLAEAEAVVTGIGMAETISVEIVKLDENEVGNATVAARDTDMV